jgi:patatin-like phospholipase/acyl hydrolase
MRRVLSIDGGGIRGAFPAAFLASVEQSIGVPIASQFDLIVGTSTGGIIALGLGLGVSAERLLCLYRELGPKVFSGNRIQRWLRRWFRPKYDHEQLRHSLTAVFGERKLGDSASRLVIPATDASTGSVYIYKTAHHPRFERDHRCKAVDVALATSAAPTYFPAHVSTDGLPLIDGGVWANNPAGVAATEAISVLGWQRGEIELLSLGTTAAPLPGTSGSWLGSGALHWADTIVEVIGASQSSGALGTARLLLGDDRVVRIDETVARGRFSLDEASSVQNLAALGAKAARTALPNLRTRFVIGPAETFLPFRS